MPEINIIQGIYSDNFYRRDGYHHPESRTYLPLPQKFRMLLTHKWAKFNNKYGITEIPFTHGRGNNGIEAIAICHTQFDDFDEKNGESIVIGRIKRMYGDLKKIEYVYEKFQKKIKIGEIDGEDVYKMITRKRIMIDSEGNPVIKRKLFYKPYDPIPEYVYQLKR